MKLMKETGLSLKRFSYFFIFFVFVVLFIVFRFYQLCWHTNFETGVCDKTKFFSNVFIFGGVLFFIISFLFFRFFCKFKFEILTNFSKPHKFFSFLGILISVAVLVCSFAILLGSGTKFSKSPTFNLLTFLAGLGFTVGMFYLSICLLKNQNVHNGLVAMFLTAFLWTTVRMFTLILTNTYLSFTQIEYKLSVAGLTAMFLFLFYLGQLIFNYNVLNAGVGVFTCGFFEVLIVFASVIPKLIVKFYNDACNIQISEFNLKSSLNIFNFYNFSFIDLIIACCTLVFLFCYMSSCRENKTKIVTAV